MRPRALPEIAAARVQGRDAGITAEFAIDAAQQPPTGQTVKNSASPESFKRFEAMVLQTFIQNMLPKDGAAVYGKGMAGDMWKSLLAENLAEVMAERGGIGIAGRVLAEHYTTKAATLQPEIVGDTAVPGSTEPGESRLPIAPAVLDGMQRSLSGLLDDESKPEAATQFATKRG